MEGGMAQPLVQQDDKHSRNVWLCVAKPSCDRKGHFSMAPATCNVDSLPLPLDNDLTLASTVWRKRKDQACWAILLAVIVCVSLPHWALCETGFGPVGTGLRAGRVMAVDVVSWDCEEKFRLAGNPCRRKGARAIVCVSKGWACCVGCG
jgi:hypothetical protein